MNTVLITGASGFFGKSFIENLLKTDFNAQFICLYHTQNQELNDSRFIWTKVDLLDVLSHKILMERFKPTHCVHLAWHVPPQNFWQSEKNLEWFSASIHLFKAFCESRGKVFIGAGSLAEYGWSTGSLNEQKSVLSPISLYGQCKKSLYEFLHILRDTYYQNTIIIWPRIGYFFGSEESDQKLISKIIDHMKKNIPLNLLHSETKRPYAHVKYLGECIAFLLFTQKQDLVVNLSATKSYKLEKIVSFIGNKLNNKQYNINYNSYIPLIKEPLILKVQTKVLKKIIGKSIPDTFFKDLEDMVRVKNATL